MFGISAGELIVIALVFLLLYGDKNLPQTLKKFSKSWIEFRKFAADTQASLHEVKNEVSRTIMAIPDELESSVKKDLDTLKNDLDLNTVLKSMATRPEPSAARAAGYPEHDADHANPDSTAPRPPPLMQPITPTLKLPADVEPHTPMRGGDTSPLEAASPVEAAPPPEAAPPLEASSPEVLPADGKGTRPKVG